MIKILIVITLVFAIFVTGAIDPAYAYPNSLSTIVDKHQDPHFSQHKGDSYSSHSAMQVNKHINNLFSGGIGGTVSAVAETSMAVSAAISAATSLSVAATSGAGITSGLAAAGSVVGGGMAAGPAVLAVGPAYLGVKIMNETLFKDQPELSEKERDARTAARTATNIGAGAGLAGDGAITVASGAAIMSTLAGIGSVVGGGAIAGATVIVFAPLTAAALAGYGAYEVYKFFGRDNGSIAQINETK